MRRKVATLGPFLSNAAFGRSRGGVPALGDQFTNLDLCKRRRCYRHWDDRRIRARKPESRNAASVAKPTRFGFEIGVRGSFF